MNPWIGTFIGWCLSWFCGRTHKTVPDVTIIYVKRLFPGWAAAQTWGKIILVKERYAKPSIIRHELVHVEQWKRLGFWGLGFLVQYLWESIIHGYENNKFEIEARERQ